MKLTNRMQLPAPIVAAVANDSYTKGDADISVTELLNPPQIVHLMRLHADELEEDASDRIWALLGQAVHSIIERASDQADTLSESTIYSEYRGWKVKGSVDHVTLSQGELCDFKVTTVWKVAGGSIPEDWIAQTNIYRRILEREKGLQIGNIAVIALLRDWSKREAQRSQTGTYPQAQVVKLQIPLWSADRTDNFITQRVAMHQMTEPLPCSDYDIWAKPDKWALMKKGAKKATKLYGSLAEAEEDCSSAFYIEHRPGEAVRCEGYCAVSQFCPQWQQDPRRKPAPLSEGLFE